MPWNETSMTLLQLLWRFFEQDCLKEATHQVQLSSQLLQLVQAAAKMAVKELSELKLDGTTIIQLSRFIADLVQLGALTDMEKLNVARAVVHAATRADFRDDYIVQESVFWLYVTVDASQLTKGIGHLSKADVGSACAVLFAICGLANEQKLPDQDHCLQMVLWVMSSDHSDNASLRDPRVQKRAAEALSALSKRAGFNADRLGPFFQAAIVKNRDTWTVAKTLLETSANVQGLVGHISLLSQEELVQDSEWLGALFYDIAKSERLQSDPIQILDCCAISVVARHTCSVDARVVEDAFFALRRLYADVSKLGQTAENVMCEGVQIVVLAMTNYQSSADTRGHLYVHLFDILCTLFSTQLLRVHDLLKDAAVTIRSAVLQRLKMSTIQNKERTCICRFLASAGLAELVDIVHKHTCTDVDLSLLRASCHVIGEGDFEPEALDQNAENIASMALSLLGSGASNQGSLRVVPDDDLLAATSALGVVVGYLDTTGSFQAGMITILRVADYASDPCYPRLPLLRCASWALQEIASCLCSRPIHCVAAQDDVRCLQELLVRIMDCLAERAEEASVSVGDDGSDARTSLIEIFAAVTLLCGPAIAAGIMANNPRRKAVHVAGCMSFQSFVRLRNSSITNEDMAAIRNSLNLAGSQFPNDVEVDTPTRAVVGLLQSFSEMRSATHR